MGRIFFELGERLLDQKIFGYANASLAQPENLWKCNENVTFNENFWVLKNRKN